MAKALLHVQGPSSRAIELVPLILAGGRLGAVWLWSPIARRFGNAMALRIAFGACGLAALPIPAAIAFGDGAELAVLLLLGWAMGGVGLLCWARLSELSAESAGAGNPAAGMMHYAFFTTATKLGLGLSGVVVGLWLASAGATHVLPVRLWTVILLVMLVSAAIAIGGGRRIPLRDDRRSTRGPSYPASAPG
jgi:GPH family glycoside/pentoside/hexuronide:cation symporter